jgi:hypothetical protein
VNVHRGDVKPARAHDLELRAEADSNVLVYPDGRRLLALNDTASALWELCDGSHTVDEMVAAIVELFHADADGVRHDVDRTIGRLHEAGAVDYDGA